MFTTRSIVLALLPFVGTACSWPGLDSASEPRDCDTRTAFYRDADGDGYGDALDVAIGCEAADGYVTVGGDCDDTDAALTTICWIHDTARADTAPADTDTAPADTDTAPADTDTAPVDTDTAPADTDTAPSDTDTAPADTDTAADTAPPPRARHGAARKACLGDRC